MIKEVKEYTDDDGKIVKAYCPLPQHNNLGGDIPTTVLYGGTVGINTPMGMMPIHFDFPKGYDLKKCFEEFETIADIEVKRQIKEAQEKEKDDNLIVIPGQGK